MSLSILIFHTVVTLCRDAQNIFQVSVFEMEMKTHKLIYKRQPALDCSNEDASRIDKNLEGVGFEGESGM